MTGIHHYLPPKKHIRVQPVARSMIVMQAQKINIVLKHSSITSPNGVMPLPCADKTELNTALCKDQVE